MQRMKKTGRPAFLLFVLFMLLQMPDLAWGQDISVNAEISPDKIFVGEQVQLKLTVSGKLSSVDQPELPAIEGLEWLRNYTSRSSSYSIVNGKPTSQTGFTYILVARESGSYTVPPIPVRVGQQTYETQPVDFQIIDRSDLPADSEERYPDIYVKLEPTNTQPVVGEQVIADIALYFKDGIQVSSYQAAPGWKAEGFWKEELDNPQRVSTSSEIINGIRYQRAKLLQYAIFPTKSGELTLSPFNITVSVRKSRRQSMDLFSFGPNQERIELETDPVSLEVQALPGPGDLKFTGGVGDFQISREVVPVEALVGESIEIVTTISGEGNVPLVDKPDYEFPESLEQYNPQENSDIRRTNRQISGTRTFTDVVIARNEGTITLPESELAWYDPESGRYRSQVLPAVELVIRRDPNSSRNTGADMRLDVQPVTGLTTWHKPNDRRLYRRTGVWLMLILPFLATALAYGYKRHLRRLQTDSAYSRNLRAKDHALKELNKASEVPVKEGYHHIEKALFQYITDKLDLPPAGLSSEDLLKGLKDRAGEDLLNELRKILKKCETIAYAPETSQEDLQRDISRCQTLITSLEKKL